MARSRRGSIFFAPIRKKTRFERFKEFLWNPETNHFLGRSGTGWGLIVIFYCCLYTCLGGFFAIMMLGLNATLDEKMPKFMLEDSPIGVTPGLNFLPRSPSMDISPILFKPSDENTWKSLVNQLKKELKRYEKNMTKNNALDCDDDDKSASDTVCNFNIDNLGKACTEKNNFGYAWGEPCVLLKLNKIIGWNPTSFAETSEKLKDYKLQRQDEADINNKYVGITCSSANPSDKDRVGKISFYPKDGFNIKYFPYLNQKDYMSPLVMVQFKNMEKNKLVNVECKAWAENIVVNRQKKRGFIRFEIKIEDEN